MDFSAFIGNNLSEKLDVSNCFVRWWHHWSGCFHLPLNWFFTTKWAFTMAVNNLFCESVKKNVHFLIDKPEMVLIVVPWRCFSSNCLSDDVVSWLFRLFVALRISRGGIGRLSRSSVERKFCWWKANLGRCNFDLSSEIFSRKLFLGSRLSIFFLISRT